MRRTRLFVAISTLLVMLTLMLSSTVSAETAGRAQAAPSFSTSGLTGGSVEHTLPESAGSTTITHSSSQTITTGNSVSCNSGGLHTDNSYYRVFDLAGDFGITDSFTVNEISFGVEQATGATGTQPISVKLYTLSGPFVLANLTQIGQEDISLANTSGTVQTAPISPAVVVPANSVLVVEIFTPNGQTAGNSFFIGSNTAAQTDPSYLRAVDCGVSQPTDTAAIGFPNMHIVINATGDVGGGGGGEGITLDKTVSTDGSCGTTDVITVTAGTEVTYCYTVTNNEDITLSLHNLEDDQLGTILANFPYDLGPGESVSVTDTDTITTDTTNTATWTAFNPVTYEADTGTCEVFPDISGTGTPLNLGDDGSADVTMPFNFQFFDISSNIATVGNNGGVFIGQPGFGIPFTNGPLPSDSVPYTILPFWDDLIQFETSANQYAGVYTPTLTFRTSEGNLIPLGGQAFVVQWDQEDHYNFDPNTGTQVGTPSEATFATLLIGPGQKGAGAIINCYEDTDFDFPDFDFGASATIGINQDATNALQFSFDTAHPELNGNFAIAYFPAGGGESFTAEDSATVNTVAPDITVTPASIAENHPTPPTTTNRTLTIGNTGDSPLTWSIYEDSTRPTIPTVSRPVAPIAPETAHSAGHAPVDRPKMATANYAPTVNLGDPIQAYGYRFTFEGTDIVEFPDILTPGTQNPVGATARSLFAGDFVAGDFTTLYAIDSDTNQFLAIDTSDASETVLGTSTPAGGESWSGLSYDPTTDTLYGSATSCASSTLYTINPSNGAATSVGSVSNAGCLIDIAVSPDGDLYGVDIINDVFLSINKASGAGTVIGSTGIDANFAQGLDFDDASGVLYYASFNNATFNGELRTINLATGASTLVGPFGADTTEIDAFAIATGGSPRCDDPSDISWLSLSSTSGTTAPGGSNNVTVTFNSASLSNGVYTGTLCVESNDFDELLTRVPVTLTVGPPTAITLTDMNIGAGGIPMVAFAVAGGLLLAAAGLVLRKREE